MMAEYIQNSKDCKSLEDMWNDLLRLHWDYLDTEENLQKLEMRKRLEGELKEFLCVVQHDRKFFLTETAHVLRQSIMKMDEFTAYKALVGFEAISLYANNLFRKPWRKEYRCIKMYCGYYQHEIKANLIDAEKLFEAMGYVLTPDHTLVLEGPICPDQVTNVSRDAMTAYVECQIMKQIFHGLTEMQLQTTWQEIFRYRETHIGNAPQAIQAMAYAIQERQYRKDKQSESCYASISAPLVCNSSCSLSHHTQHPTHHLVPSHYSQYANGTTNGTCNPTYAPSSQLCSSSGQQTTYAVNSNQVAHPTIPHSKSLEHYRETIALPGHHHARHSIDQPVAYDYGTRSYDCLDGQTVNTTYQHQPTCAMSMTANHPYNVSGNRFPLPPSISNQLHNDHHYAQIGGYVPPLVSQSRNYINANGFGPTCVHQNMHYDCSNNFNGAGHRPLMPHELMAPTCDLHGQCYANNGRNRVIDHHLIDFDEKTMSGKLTDIVDDSSQHYFCDPLQTKAYYEGSSKSSLAKGVSLGKQLKYLQQNRGIDEATNQNYHSTRDAELKRVSLGKKYTRNAELLGEYEEQVDTNDSRNSRASDFDSFESSNNLSIDRDCTDGGGVGTDQSTSSKIRDGVGSYETWNYVFQNIGKNGYNKNGQEPNNLTMQGLDLNAKISAEKRRSRNLDPPTTANTNIVKRLNGETPKVNVLKKTLVNGKEASSSAGQKAVIENGVSHRVSSENGQSRIKANVTDHIENGYATAIGAKSKTGTIKKVLAKQLNGKKSTADVHTMTPKSSMDGSNKATVNAPIRNSNGPSTDTVRPASNEWSCKFCTFLNPSHLRICQMCYKSQDFVLDAPQASTCV